MHLRRVAEAVKRGVWAAGGVPLEFPTISLGELFMKPTTMLFRNLMAMDVEECITANPIDGVVLLSGCDKTTPAQLMGAASADLPAVMVTGGPQLSGHWGRKEIGSGTDGRLLFQEYRAGRLTDEQLAEVEGCIARSNGHCMVMGTASTMASMADPWASRCPGPPRFPLPTRAASSSPKTPAGASWTWFGKTCGPRRFSPAPHSRTRFGPDMAIGGSTNAVVHLLAIAGRAGVDLRLSDFDRLSRETPFLANIKPSGSYLMEDFYYAGGLPVVMKEILPLLDGSSLTANGRTVAENVADAACSNTDVIRPLDRPLNDEGGTAILYGNLAPDGAVIKQTAASPHLLQHRGKAVVFDRYEELRARIDDDDLEIDENSVLVLKHAGPTGGPGFPEWGHLPIPAQAAQAGD